MKNLAKLSGATQITKAQQKDIKGGYYPTLYQFCCTRTQGFWLSRYPSTDEYNCFNVDC